MSYDLLVFPKQLPAAIEVVHHLPEQPFVLDHLAKPRVKTRALSPWREQIQELAKAPNVCCKISGLVTEADWTNWKPEDFRPYLDIVCEAFGEDRLMVGSDWPVCLLAARYEHVIALAREYFGSLAETAQEKIFASNALKFYGLSAGQPGHFPRRRSRH